MTSRDAAPDVEAALRSVYDDEPDFRWVTKQRWEQGGPDPLDEVVIYARDDPVPHWHYVGVGLTSTAVGPASARHVGDDAGDGRGWRFELTARLARSAAVDQNHHHHAHPPVFLVNVLQNLARYVAETGNALGPGHTMNLYGPIQEGSETPVRHVLFVEDPELGRGARETAGEPAGPPDFLQVVGLTEDEAAAKKTWTDVGFAALFERYHPLLVTRLDRASILADPGAAAAVEAGRARDGSSLAGLVVETLAVARGGRLARLGRRASLTVSLGADVVNTLCAVLPHRIAAGLPFHLENEHTRLTFVPDAGVDAHEHEPGEWTVGLSPAQAAVVAARLQPLAGSYRVRELRGVDFLVVRTTVRDADDRPIGTIG